MRETMESVDVLITWSALDSSDACALTGLDAVPIMVYGAPGDWERICVRREPVPPEEAWTRTNLVAGGGEEEAGQNEDLEGRAFL